MEGSDKETTPIGRYLHPETPCPTCVPYKLMPINMEAYSVFMLCRNAVLRDGEGKPYDVDIGAVATAVIAKKYDCLTETVNLIRFLLSEEVL